MHIKIEKILKFEWVGCCGQRPRLAFRPSKVKRMYCNLARAYLSTHNNFAYFSKTVFALDYTIFMITIEKCALG